MITLLLQSCSQPDKTNSITIPDKSHFEYDNKISFSFLKNLIEKGLINQSPDTLTAAQKKAWNYTVEGFNSLEGFYYGGTFYSLQHKVNDITPIVIEGSSDDYEAFTLLCLDKNGKLISYLDLAGGIMGGPDSTYEVCDDSVIYFTHEKFSSFLNDSVFNVNDVNYIDNIHNSTYTIDSITRKYQIRPSGKIDLIKKDSVRVLKKEVYDY